MNTRNHIIKLCVILFVTICLSLLYSGLSKIVEGASDFASIQASAKGNINDADSSKKDAQETNLQGKLDACKKTAQSDYDDAVSKCQSDYDSQKSKL
jgi:hypothetical protein